MADQLAFLPERVLTAAAMPGAGYKVSFYESGTTTPVTVYTSASLLTAHPSPLVCDATGVFPQVFSAGGAIKAVVQKPDNSTFYTVDPVFRVSTSASGASDVTFSATVDLPFTNVQEAIEGAAASAASGFTPFGLGVTGTNALLANLDATSTASGAYRFDGTTTGTYPTSVSASDTGTVQIWRENAGDAVMWLQSGTADRGFTRRMASSTWGAWREIITVPTGAARGDLIRRGATNFDRLALGTSGQVLTSDGTDAVWGNSPFGQLVGGTVLSGGSTTLSSIIPTDASEILIAWVAVSTDASTTTRVRVGNGSLQSTNYETDVYAGAVGSNLGLTDAFHLQHAGQVNTQVNRGSLLLTRVDSVRWFGRGMNFNSNQSCIYDMSGTVTVTGGITHAGMVTATGNFDAGTGFVAWRR